MRTARKLTAVAASVALIGAGSLLAATPAHASSFTVTCSGASPSPAIGNDNSTWTVTQGAGNCQQVLYVLGSGISQSDVTFTLPGGATISAAAMIDPNLATALTTSGTATLNYTGSGSGVISVVFESTGPIVDY